jgi:DNA-binding protein YbaB
MTVDGEELIRLATQELRRRQEGLQAEHGRLKETPTQVTSKDGLLTVTLNGGGQLTSVRFNSQKFRRMAPAELGMILVEAISRAQTESRDRVLHAYQRFLPPGFNARDVMNGEANLNDMFEDARRQADEILADGKSHS